jgi:hypothetical protein
MQKIQSKANVMEYKTVIENTNMGASIGKFSIEFAFIFKESFKSETLILKSKAMISLTKIKMYIPMR